MRISDSVRRSLLRKEIGMFLAQAAAPVSSGVAWFSAASAGFAVLGVMVVFLVLLFRHLHSVRQLTHTERMRTLEAGFPLEAGEGTKAQAKFMHNAFWISFWLVFSVPAAALSAAATATGNVNGSTTLVALIWSGAVAASVAAVGGATVLMLNSQPRKTDESMPMQMGKKVA
jgi:hypothetical protein